MRSTSSSDTGTSPLWWPDWASLRRAPLTSTSACPKEAPRIAKSAWTPRGPRSRTSTLGTRRSASIGFETGSRARSRRVRITSVRPRLPSASGETDPVTTTVSRTSADAPELAPDVAPDVDDWAEAVTADNRRGPPRRRGAPKSRFHCSLRA